MSGKKKTILIVALLLVVFIGSISYALWSVTLEQTDSNIVKTGCFTVDMVEETDEINLPEEYPVVDSVGNNYSPFTFTIQNTCTIDSSYSVNLKVDEEKSTLDRNSVKVSLDQGTPQILTDYEKAPDEEKYQLATGTLAGASSEGSGDGESITYDLRLWLDKDTPDSEMSKDFYAKIVIENITTSGVEAREVLATLDYSKTESDDVTVNYYNNGLVEITGTGEMSVELEGIIPETVNYLLVNNSEISKVAAQIPNLSSTAQGFIQAAAYASFGSYKAVTESMLTGTGVSLDNVTNNEELYNALIEAINSNTSLFAETDLELLPDMLKIITNEIKVIKSIQITDGITSIGERVFKYFENVEIILPSSIKKIGESAFEYAYVDLKLNEELTELNTHGAFYRSRIATLELPSKLQALGPSIFENSIIESIVIPEGVTRINDKAFANTQNLTSVIILGDITRISVTAFDNLTVNPNLVIKFAMSEDKKELIKVNDLTDAESFDFTNYNVVWGYTE